VRSWIKEQKSGPGESVERYQAVKRECLRRGGGPEKTVFVKKTRKRDRREARKYLNPRGEIVSFGRKTNKVRFRLGGRGHCG